MGYQIPSLKATIDYVRAVGRAIWTDRAFDSEFSYHSRKATYAAASVTQLHQHVAAVQRDAFPTTASEGKPITDWGELFNVVPKPATPARKSQAGRVTGTPGSVAPAESILIQQSTGLKFKLASTVTIINAAPNNFVDADIIAIDTGAVTRLDAGTTLRFYSGIAGINPVVRLQLALDEDGDDAEPFGAFRARLLQVIASIAAGGNASDWVRWLEAMTGIVSGYSLGNRAGVGSQDVVAFHGGAASSRILSDAERATVLAALQQLAPNQLAATGAQLRVLKTVPDLQDVELAVVAQANPAYQFDWDDTTPLVVATYNAMTRTVATTLALPSSMKAGHRVTIKGVNSAQDGRQYKVQAIVSAFSFLLETAPPVDPIAGDVLFSGGPLVDPIRNAILAHLNGEDVYTAKGQLPAPASSLSSTVGLEVLAEGIGPANPGGKYGAWTGGIVLAVLGKIASTKGGVRDVFPVVPAANYEPLDDPFPNDAQIHFIVPRSVIIRRKV